MIQITFKVTKSEDFHVEQVFMEQNVFTLQPRKVEEKYQTV